MTTETTNVAAEGSGAVSGTSADEAGDKVVNVAAGDAATAAGVKDESATTAGGEVELKLPEGVRADEALIGRFKALARESGLDSPKAQKLYDFYLQTQQDAAKAVDAEMAQLQKDWAKQVQADKEIGGVEFKANFQVARKAVERFATPELKKYLAESGLGGHPEIIRLFHRIGKAVAEDSIAGTADNGRPAATGPDQVLRKMYPNSPQMFPKE